MRKLALAVLAAAALLFGTAAPASAHWHGHYHWGGPGLALGLIAGTLAAAAAPPVIYEPVYYPVPRYYRPYRVVRYYPPVYPYWYPW